MRQRQKVYPNRVTLGRMSQRQADHALVRAALAAHLPPDPPAPQRPLFPPDRIG